MPVQKLHKVLNDWVDVCMPRGTFSEEENGIKSHLLYGTQKASIARLRRRNNISLGRKVMVIFEGRGSRSSMI